MAEGAVIVILEDLEHAWKRGAHIYAEVAGYGVSCDANHLTAPHPEGRGAAGGVEAIVTALAIGEQYIPQTDIPQTGNLENPDPEYDPDYVPGKGFQGKIRVALSNSLGFGGHNGILCLKQYGS